MGRLSITSKIWLSIGIFVVGFLVSTSLQQVEGLRIERALRITSEGLSPATRISHEATTAFQDMVEAYRAAVDEIARIEVRIADVDRSATPPRG